MFNKICFGDELLKNQDCSVEAITYLVNERRLGGQRSRVEPPQGTTPVMRKTVTHQNCIYSNRNVERQIISLCYIFYSNRKVVLSASYAQEVQADIPIIIYIVYHRK